MKCPKCEAENPATARFCLDCGAVLPSGTKAAHPEVTETLQTPVRELTTGSTFAGRYQVIEELGRGGMGRVYKVQDTDIKEKVALKLLRPEITLDKEAVERFSNELKLARRIGHRNVCKMFDLGRAEGTTFITMEFIPGEDLKSFLHRSKQLNIGTAISIAKQVCEGLEEAHRLGVIHRDLKPGNIMIDKDGDAKIMDFGIARSLSGRGITGAGVLVGTPEYMSPEQVEGKDIDQRSDLYSLGVILYEMVTGRQPFAGDTPLSVAHKQKYEAPEDPKKLNTQVSDDLARVILKCLAKDRNGRFQSAAELGAELGRIEQGLPTTDRIVRKRRALTSKEITVKFRLTKVLVPVSVFVLLVLAGFVLWRVVQSRKPALSPSASGQPILAVLYFENKSGDPKLDNWRDALAELLIAGLSQSRYIRVVSGDEMYTILRRLGLADARKYSSEDIEKIAAEAQATHVLRGNFIKAGESFIITAGLQEPGTGESATALRLEARDENDIIPKVDELTRQVKEGLNLTAVQIAGDIGKEAGKITTSSPEALKYYLEGRKCFQTDPQKSIELIKRAIDIDPAFAMAYRALGMAYANLGYVSEAIRYHQKALELSDGVSERERYGIEGAFYWRKEKTFDKAIQAYKKLLELYPEDSSGNLNLGCIYRDLEQWDKAVEYIEIARRVSPDSVYAFGNLARLFNAKGIHDKANEVLNEYSKNNPDNEAIRAYRARNDLIQRRFQSALAEAEKGYFLNPTASSVISIKGDIYHCMDDIANAEIEYARLFDLGGNINQISAHEKLAALYISAGKYEKSIDQLVKEIELTRASGEIFYEPLIHLEFAYRNMRSGDYISALKDIDDAWKSADDSESESSKIMALHLRGAVQARMKSFSEAKRTAVQLEERIGKWFNRKLMRYHDHLLGTIELEGENFHKATEYFDKALSLLPYESVVDGTDQHAFFVDSLARACFQKKDLVRAKKEYEKITQLTTGRLYFGDIYAQSYYMLGKIAEQQGDKARARENFRKFLDLWKDADPGLPEPADARKRLALLQPS